MTRSASLVLLAVFGVGVFLTGLELMITAVALPAIILDFSSDPVFAFVELRKASWIVNAYLLAYVVTMPLAGRLSDLWGARRLFLGALAVFIVGSALAGRAQSLDELGLEPGAELRALKARHPEGGDRRPPPTCLRKRWCRPSRARAG